METIEPIHLSQAAGLIIVALFIVLAVLDALITPPPLQMKHKHCIEPECRKKRAKGRRRCAKHVTRRWREANPLKAIYWALRTNARRRGHFFNLTVEQLKLEIQNSGYMELRGITPKSLTIDRIHGWLGYRYGNLQVISNEANVRKYHEEDKVLIEHIMDYEECPF